MTQLTVLGRPVQVGITANPTTVHEWGNPCDQSVRVSVFVGFVSGTVNLELQGSDGHGVWTDTKSGTIGASTNKTLTFTASSSAVASTAHGYLPGDQVALISNGGTLPSPFVAGQVYYVQTAATNSFTLGAARLNGTPLLVASGTGSGAQTATIIREAEITVQALSSADQTVTPIKPHLRLTTQSDDGIIQIVEIKSSL